MADFCHECTFEMFGEGYAPFNDMTNPDLGDDFMQSVLCEGCGYINVDKFGRKLHWDEKTVSNVPDANCPHGVPWEQCRVVVQKSNKDAVAYVSALNFHGVGEFIAQYREGDASSDEIKLYVPTCNTWENIDRMLTP